MKFINALLLLTTTTLTIASLSCARASTSYTLLTFPQLSSTGTPLSTITSVYSFLTEAQHTIDVTMYELEDTTFTTDLVAEEKKGITVRVILDASEMSHNQAAYTALVNGGCTVHWSNGFFTNTHQKTITLDGYGNTSNNNGPYGDAQTMIMTLNLQSQYYSSTRDYAVIENDPTDISAIETVFAYDLANNNTTNIPDGDDLVWSPTNAQTELLAIINTAQYSLQIENEEMSDTNIVTALENAAKRGVTVEVTMTANSEYDTEFAALTKAGVDVELYPSSSSDSVLYIHGKTILADYDTPTELAFIGSENFSSTSLLDNRELGIVTTDPATLASLSSTLSDDFDDSNTSFLDDASAYSGSEGDFSLYASSDLVSVAQRTSASTTISLTPTDGFSSTVSLGVSGLPTGVTAVFSTSPITKSTSSVLTFNASSTATPGTYTVMVAGTGGSLTRETGIELTVGASASNVSSSVTVRGTGLTRVGRTTTYSQTVTITNNTVSAITGPISYVLDSLSPNISITNETGVTTAASGGAVGSPSISSSVNLAPAASTTFTVLFADPNSTAITYLPRVLAGAGSR